VRILYVNARVYSATVPDATALVVDDGRIAWLGDLGPDQAASMIGADERIDLDGALVTPAFVDAHVHATATGLALTGLDLSATRSLAEALERVAERTRAGRGRPILGSGWDETNWPERRPPTREELDRASFGGSVYLARVDAHSAVVSTAVLATVRGISELRGYRPDGWLTLAAHDAARVNAFGALTPGQLRQAQRAARTRAAEQGIGALHEMAGPEVSSAEDLRSLLALARDEDGPEIVGYWGELFGIEAARDLGAIGAGGDLFCDGSIGSHTAALDQPYADAPDISGELRFSVAELTEHLRRCSAAGLQAGFHAIGNAAVDAVISAVEQAGAPARGGHRLEHAEYVDDPDRLAATGLIASMQPAFDARWGMRSDTDDPQGMYEQRLGSARARRLNRFAQLAAAGVPLAFSSDAPITPLDPWAAVQAAAYPSDPSAAISPRAAFAAHTRGGWRAARGDGDGSGMLTVGAPATFAAWRTGPLGVHSADERVARWSTDERSQVPGLPDLRPGSTPPHCLRTVVRGRAVFLDPQPA
jgi:predicted amidohydrolase YtcJ